MKKELLTAALLGCLLLPAAGTEARHLAEQQAMRVEEALRQQGVQPQSGRRSEEERIRREQEARERQAELRHAEAVREQAERERNALQEAEAQIHKAAEQSAPVTEEAVAEETEATAEEALPQEPAPNAAEQAQPAPATEPVAEPAPADKVTEPVKADDAAGPAEAEPAPAEQVNTAAAAPTAEKLLPPQPAAQEVQPVAEPLTPEQQAAEAEQKRLEQERQAAEAEKKRLEQEEQRLLAERRRAADERRAAHPAARKPLRMKHWEMNDIDGDGTLLFSSSPEYVKQPGLLYADVVRGKARVLYYHVNETKQPCRLLVVLTNSGSKTATVKLTRGATAPPSEDYLGIGKATQVAYFAQPLTDTLQVPAGGSCLLRSEMESIILKPDDLIYGVYDFVTDETVKVSFVLCPVTEQSLAYAAKAPLLSRAEPSAGRGTFVGMDRTLTAARPYNPKRDGAVYFWLGDDNEDLFVTGIDATDGSIATNYGNYGINYKIYLPLAGGAKERARAWLNPCGGVYAGAVAELMADGSWGRMLETPRGAVFFGEDGAPSLDEDEAGNCRLTQENELQELALEAKDGLAFVFSPPGASYLPVRLILTPDLAKKKKKS